MGFVHLDTLLSVTASDDGNVSHSWCLETLASGSCSTLKFVMLELGRATDWQFNSGKCATCRENTQLKLYKLTLL